MKRLRREEARRIAVRAQLLDADGRRDLPAVLERLTFLQLDPTATVAPSADLVAWSRLGDAYRPADLQNALEMERTVFEHRAQDVSIEPILALLRPVSSLGLYLAEMRAWPPPEWGRVARWLEANDAFRRRLLDQLRAEGPLKSSDIKDTSAVSWQSSGWTNDRNVTQMLEFLASRGEVAVAGRQGRQRLWDVAERIFPVDVAAVPVEVALAERDRRRLRSLGIARPQYAGGAGVEVEVEGTQGVWRLDPDATAEGFRGRIVLLSPFDRLVHNRARALEVFEFEYTLEMYKPAAQRRWGAYALPILHDDRLVGKVDAVADRKRSRLHVNAVHEDMPFTAGLKEAVDDQLEALARWLGLEALEVA